MPYEKINEIQINHAYNHGFFKTTLSLQGDDVISVVQQTLKFRNLCISFN